MRTEGLRPCVCVCVGAVGLPRGALPLSVCSFEVVLGLGGCTIGGGGAFGGLKWKTQNVLVVICCANFVFWSLFSREGLRRGEPHNNHARGLDHCGYLCLNGVV